MSLIIKFKNYLILIASSITLFTLLQWTPFSFSLPTSLYYKMSWKSQFLINSSGHVLSLLILIPIIAILNRWGGHQVRRWTAMFGLSAIMLYFFPWQVICSLFTVYVILYLALVNFLKKTGIFTGLVVLAVIGLGSIFVYLPMNRYAYLLLMGQTVFGFYSALIDKHRGLKDFDAIHLWLHWFCFPGGLFTILYGYKNFSESFHKQKYSAIFSKGSYLIGLSIFQLITVQLIQIYSFPDYSFLRNKVATVAEAGDTVYSLWIHGFEILFFFILEQIGTINLLQGITQIFGYDVERQIDGLWKANSFLDVWKRGSYNTRMYWINYIYMPILLKTKNIYISDLSVWFIYGLIASMAYGGINIYYTKPDSISEIWITIFIKHFIMYGFASCLEMYINKNYLMNKNKSVYLKYALRLFLLLLMYIIYIIGNEFGPNPNSTLVETIEIILKMFGAI